MRKLIYLFIFSFGFIYNLHSQSSMVLTSRFNSNNDDIARFMAVDSKGSMYIGGNTFSTESTRDYLLLKYDRHGNYMWSKIYNGTGNGNDTIASLFIDINDNVYVTGSSTGFDNSFDITTIKYSPNGDVQWIRRYDEYYGSYSSPFEVIVDNNSNVYVVGWCDEYNSYDCLLLKYSQDGELIWKKKMNGSANTNDEAYTLAFSPDQEYLYVGACLTEITGGPNFALFKYDLDGTLIWLKTHDGLAGDNDYIRDITVDLYGNVYVAGTTEGVGTESDITTAKYNKDGDKLWVRYYDGPGHGVDWVNSIKLDKDNDNVFLVGGIQGITYDPNINLKERNDGFVMKYNTRGEFQWIGAYDGPNHFHDCAQGLDLDEEGNVYMTGRTCVTGYDPSDNIFTIKFSNAGSVLWKKFYDGPHQDADYGAAIIYNPVSKKIFSAGHSKYSGISRSDKKFDVILFKYDQDTPMFENFQKTQTLKMNNYPNPFNPVTQIQFTITKDDFVKLSVYDLSGRLIKNLTEGYKTAGSHNITFDGSNLSSGVYLYTLQTSSDKITNKFILNK